MKMKTVSLLAGASVTLILAGTASGEFIGLQTVAKFVNPADIAADNFVQGNLLSFNVYAVFTPGDAAAAVIAVGGTAGIPLQVNASEGTFFQHPHGATSHLSPSAALANIPGFDALKYDSFVTIGRKLDSDPVFGGDLTQVSGLDSWTTTQLTGSDVRWFVDGFPAQGDAGGGPDNPPDEVLIAQFTVANFGFRVAVMGSMFINGRHTNAAGVVEEFTTIGIIATDFHPICVGDLDGDGVVGVPDLLLLLAQWGVCPAQCFADIDGDGVVGAPDLLTLLAAWGPCQ